MPQVHGLCLVLVWPNGPNIAKTIVHAIYESKLCTPEIETILSVVTDELEQIKRRKKYNSLIRTTRIGKDITLLPFLFCRLSTAVDVCCGLPLTIRIPIDLYRTSSDWRRKEERLKRCNFHFYVLCSLRVCLFSGDGYL